MKSTAIVFAVAASLGFGSLALAQGNDRRGHSDELPRPQQQAPQQTHQSAPQRYDNRAPQRVEQRVEQRVDQRTERRVERGDYRRHDQRFDSRFDPRFDQREERWNNRRPYYNARGPEFVRGAYMPREYRAHSYVVNDYRSHRLPPPPRHQQWVQVGSDYVLVAIATGIIASIVLNR